MTYGTAPAVGLDVRVAMTDHVRLVPGLRLLAIDENGRTGWMTRPRSASSGPSDPIPLEDR